MCCAVCRAGSIVVAREAGGVLHSGRPHFAQLPPNQHAHLQHPQDARQDHGSAVPGALCVGRPHTGCFIPEARPWGCGGVAEVSCVLRHGTFEGFCSCGGKHAVWGGMTPSPAVLCAVVCYAFICALSRGVLGCGAAQGCWLHGVARYRDALRCAVL